MKTEHILGLLHAYESRNITFIDPDGSWPMVWERARGVSVWDAEGRKYLDLTAAFGVAAAGHANPRVVKAGQAQMARLLHAMGDVHPHRLKAELARELSRITFERWSRHPAATRPTSGKFCSAAVSHKAPVTQSRTEALARKQKASPSPTSGKTVFCNSGFEAVEAALKTAMLATGKPGVIAFQGAYHGLGYGALNATHRQYFRSPFRKQLREFATFVPFPLAAEGKASAQGLRLFERSILRVIQQQPIGAVLVEPVQGRGGIRIPPLDFLPLLRRVCDQHRALLVLDEIYTGFGRTGKWFACEHSGVTPDLICLGKALTGGFPLSACVGRAEVMDTAWPNSPGEAIHTSTFLGHPVGCAMALAQVRELESRRLIERSARLGGLLLARLSRLVTATTRFRLEVRGVGLLAGLEVQLPDGSPATAQTFSAIKAMLRRGFILLPEGEHGNVISFTPPLTITESQLESAADALAQVLPALR